MSGPGGPDSERALVHAPRGRDALIACQLLAEAGVPASACPDLRSLVQELESGAGLVVLTEEATREADMRGLRGWIDAQPPWSDMPFLVLTERGGGLERNPHAGRLTEALGNVTFLERPFHPTTLASLARTALRGRRRQYQARGAAEALRRSEAGLRFALEAGRLGAWEIDTESRELSCSDLCKLIYGRPADQPFSFTDLLAAIHPGDRPLVEAAMLATSREARDYAVDYRVPLPDGGMRWVEVRGRKLFHDGAAPTIAGVAADITARKLAEQQLRASETRYRTLTETLPQLVWTCLPDGSCDWLSRQWVEYTGLGMDEQLGLDWLDRVIHPDDRARTYEHWMGAVTGRNPYDIEYRIRARDGSYTWFKTRGSPIRDEQGELVYWFGTCTDIQAIVEAREIAARGRDQLERLVAERTADLEQALTEREETEAQLRQAQKMEAVGQLTGGIAHDFNNLLQVISGGLELLDRAEDPARRARMMDGMRQAASRGAQLTRQLLAFSRKQALRPESIDLAQQVERMNELLVRSLRGDISLETEFTPDLWPVMADPTQLELAVINAAVNARDAMPRGGEITIRACNVPSVEQRDLSGDFVRLEITDTGEGMPPEVVARVFEPFFTTKEVGKGSGLGLPQVYGFVRQSGGAVRIQSEPGRGTTVSLLLPRADAPPRRTDWTETEPRAPIQPQGAGDGSRRGVLLVEDDDEVAALAVEMLAQLGYRVRREACAADALRALAEDEPVDLVFSDVMMPGGMNGAELAREVRRRRPGLPVVLTTGFDGAGLGGAETEGLAVIRKPYRLSTLAEVLYAHRTASPPP